MTQPARSSRPPASVICAGSWHWPGPKAAAALDSIITNDSFDGPAYVAVNTLEFVKFSRGCTWELQP